jgi:hypothetical protein
LIVRKGRVILSDSHTKVKGGNKVVFSATAVSVAKLTKEEKKLKEKEAVDLWSKERAETLAKANRKISDRMLNTAFASYRDWDPFGSRIGLWFFSSRLGCYTFLPFYYGWGSPYGSSYTTSFYYPGGTYYPRGSTNSNWPAPAGSTTSTSGQTYPSGGTAPAAGPRPAPSITPRDGGFQRQPRMSDPDTGNRMPRKNIEPSRP